MPSLIGRIKQNRIGAVVVSVFDWYREPDDIYICKTLTWYSIALPRRGEKTVAKARSRYSSLWMFEL